MSLRKVRIESVIQGEQNVSVHLMITTQKVTSNVQSVNLTAWQPTARARGH
jgi:hypothetical protein